MPYTYYLPNDPEIAAVGVGDHVKLVFKYRGPVAEWAVERMWIKVSAVAGATLTGTLDNDPAEPNAAVKLGDRVTFDRVMLIDIDWAKPDRAPPPTPRRDYWDRCMVDGCILTGEPVDYLYREEPDMARKATAIPTAAGASALRRTRSRGTRAVPNTSRSARSSIRTTAGCT